MHFERQEKNPQQSPSIPPFAGSMNINTFDRMITSSRREISPAPLDNGHRVRLCPHHAGLAPLYL